MPKASRRRFATLIRIRQELDKRLDRVVPSRMGPSALDGLLVPSLDKLAASPDGDALRQTLAAAAADRFPLAHLEERDPATLPARQKLELSIADAARGNWTVFGDSLVVDVARHEWTTHPLTRARAAREHWTRVPYMNGIGGGDVKTIWELSRHHQLVRLAQGYFLSRPSPESDVQVERLLTLLDSWIGENPSGFGVNWTSSLEVAFRAVAWCWVWALTCDSPAWTRVRVRRFLVALWHHARHVERFDSIHHSPNTHLTGEGLGLLYVGLLFPEFRRAARWASRGREILETELDVQLLDDGMHYERSVGYHKYTAEFYIHYLLLARASGLAVAQSVQDSVRAQITVARLFRRPDGTWPVIGDEDSGDTLLLSPVDPQDQGPVLALGAGIFRNGALMALTADEHRATCWWLLDDQSWQWVRDWPANPALGNGSNCADAPNSAAMHDVGPALDAATGAMRHAGYFVGRENESESAWWCLVDAGPHGGDQTGHAHTDLGHVEIAHGATHVVVDPGCAGYTIGRPARDHARSEAAHACLVVDGAPLAVPSSSFSWARTSPTPGSRSGSDGRTWWCELSYERGDVSGRLNHRRQVVLVRGAGVIVCDWIDGSASEHFAVHWPLGDLPNDDALTDAGLTTDRYALAWSTSDAGVLDASLRPTTRAPGYGRQVPARLVRLEYRGALPATIVTCFANPTRPFGRHLHDGQTVRIELPSDDAGPPRTLSIQAGAAPSLDRPHVPAPSLRVSR